MIQWFHFSVFIQKNKKTLVWKDMLIPMFIGALFTITKIWKKLKNIWIDKDVMYSWDIEAT